LFVTTTVPPDGAEKLEAERWRAESGPVADDGKRMPCDTQVLLQTESAGEWGLGRISHLQKFPVTGLGWPSYVYDSAPGYCNGRAFNGGVAYVIDSGVLANHAEFATANPLNPRAVMGFRADLNWPNTDVCGHGTHVKHSTAFAESPPPS
jgi:subtilisin family serine protease